MAARWSEEYARCRACWAHGPDRPHLDGGLCVVCYGDLYGLTGLADVPPDWAEEGSEVVSIAEYREKHGVPPAPFTCVGWLDDKHGHHPCGSPLAERFAKGRCKGCYNREYNANGRVMHPATLPTPTLMPQPQPQPQPVAVVACAGWVDVTGTARACRVKGVPTDEGRCEACARMQRGADVARDAAGREGRGATLAELVPAETAERLREAATATVGARVVWEVPEPEPQPEAAGYRWEVFDQLPHVSLATEPRVSIAKDANVRINGPAYALWGREVAAVELLFDRGRRALALRPCAEGLPHARKLRPDKAARCCSLRAFQSATGLLGEATRVLVPRLVGDLLILDLA